MNRNYVPERMHRGQILHGEINFDGEIIRSDSSSIGNRMNSSRSSSGGSSSNTDDKC